MIYKFFDTASFQKRIKGNYIPVISSITAEQLKENNIEIYDFNSNMLKPFAELNLITDDIKILACAFDYDCCMHPDETIFVTTNSALAELANKYFGEDSIELV